MSSFFFYPVRKVFIIFFFFMHLFSFIILTFYRLKQFWSYYRVSIFVLTKSLNLFLFIPTPRSGNFHDRCTFSFRELGPRKVRYGYMTNVMLLVNYVRILCILLFLFLIFWFIFPLFVQLLSIYCHRLKMFFFKLPISVKVTSSSSGRFELVTAFVFFIPNSVSPHHSRHQGLCLSFF